MYPRSVQMPGFSTQRQSKRQRTQSVLAIMLLGTLVGSANAQNALGDGTALDANSGQGGRVNYTKPSFARELSFRNAIATGNAPGGLSFRGDLGYRAAGEFTGQLGSDSLFAFRRDSLYSGLAGMGIRGTDALQYQFALTTGSAPPQNLMGNLSVTRSDYSSYSNPYGANQSGSSSNVSPIGINNETDVLDRRGRGLSASEPTLQNQDTSSMLGTLRSSSTYTTTSNLQPAIMSVYLEGVDRKPVGLIASPLLGITSIPLVQTFDKNPNPLVARPQSTSTTIDSDGNPSRAPGSARLETSYDGIIAQMRERAEEMRARPQIDTAKPNSDGPADGETNDEWLIRQMQELRDKLYGQKPANDDQPDPATDPNADPNANPDANPLDAINDPDSPLDQRLEDFETGINTNAEPIELYDPTEMNIDPETLEVLRGSAANEIQRLLDPGADKRDIYVEHMTAGERLIASGRYFDAEERFTHALSLRPRDVSAQLGRLHAQIGAGMVLSASVNLQALLSQRPEIIASRYSGDLLPSKPRAESLISRLKERAGLTMLEYSTRRLESNRVRVSSAMVLAYLGYQIDDSESVQQAIQVINERGSDSDKRFASLLSQLWLNDSAQDSSDGAINEATSTD